jgi:hypothetical protein
MLVRRHILAMMCGAVLWGAAFTPAETSAQTVVGVGVGRGPVFYDPWYGYYGYPWYPRVYAQRPYYGYYNYFASIRLQVTPRDAEVFVDGYLVGTVDDFDGVFQRLDLEPGEHEIELFMPGYRSVRERVYLQPGRTSRLRLAMEPLAPGEPLPVRPSGAVSPPGSGSPAPGGRRPLPAPGRPGAAPDDLIEPVERTGQYGSLSLRVQPGDATVLIDGERWEGSTNADDRLVVQVAAGRHVVEIQKEGYRRYVTEITVRPGETTTINVSLNTQ